MKRYTPLFSEQQEDLIKFIESLDILTEEDNEEAATDKLDKIRVGLNKIGLHILNTLQQSGIMDNALLEKSGKAIVMFPIMYIQQMLLLSGDPELFTKAMQEMQNANARINKIYSLAKYKKKAMGALAKKVAAANNQTTGAIKTAQSKVKGVYRLSKSKEETSAQQDNKSEENK